MAFSKSYLSHILLKKVKVVKVSAACERFRFCVSMRLMYRRRASYAIAP